MGSQGKKCAVILGKYFLALALAPLSTLAEPSNPDAVCGSLMPPTLRKNKEAIVKAKCWFNSGVPVNVQYGESITDDSGACEDSYASIKKAAEVLTNEQRTGSCAVLAELRAKRQECASATGERKSRCGDEFTPILTRARSAVKALKEKLSAEHDRLKAAADAAQNAGKKADETDKQIVNTAKTEKAKHNQAKESGVSKADPKDSRTALVSKNGVSSASQYDDKKANINGLTATAGALVAKEQFAAAQEAKQSAQELDQEIKKLEAQEQQFAQMEKVSRQVNTDDIKSVKKPDENLGGAPKSGEAPKTGEKTAEGKGGGMPEMPKIPGGGDKGGSPDAGGVSAATPNDTGNTGTPGLIGTSDSNSAKSKASELALASKEANPDETGLLNGPLSSSGSSRVNKSLRDSLKKKLLGDQAEAGSGDALGGLPFGDGASAGKNGKPASAGSSPLALPSFGGELASGGGSSDSGDFSMARSETEEAVHHLLNEFTQPGGKAGLEDDRSLADIESGGLSSLEGSEGTPLFSRVRGTIVRYLKKGRVVNGVNGKI